MGDVAQILSGQMGSAAQESLPPPPPPPPPSHHPSRAMKMTSMSREVLDLMSGNQEAKSAALPPMVPTIAPAQDLSVKVGNKFISANKPAKKWKWANFSSSARTDGALFCHWVRDGIEYPDYPYARFDVHLDPVTYTLEEYNRFLQHDDWTKSETDKLMDLARVYELRWAVIYDRWCDFYPPRKIEELEYRYYSIAATLLQQRVAREAASEVAALSSSGPVVDPSLPAEEQKAIHDHFLMETAAARALASAPPQHQPLMANIGTGSSNKNSFDLAKERERRAHLEVIWHRTKEEELEETQLRKELRQVEAQIRKLKKSGGHILAAGGGASSQNPSRSASPVPTTVDSSLLDQCFASTAPTPMPGTPYLQSGRLVPPATGGPLGINKTTLKRLDTVMEELHVPERPMPTKRVCDLYDSVRKNALTLITLQKMVIQKEAQLQNKRMRLAKMGGGGRVVDEEALLGIAPAAAPPATAPGAPAPAASRSKSTGTKTKKSTKTKTIKPAGETKMDATTATTTITNPAVKPAPGGKAAPGKAAPGKQGRKAGTKRKKKTEKAATAPIPAPQEATGTVVAAKGDTKPPAKKRVRKS